MKKKSTQVIANVVINKYEFEEEIFYSLTDMAKYRNEENPSDIIRSWISNQGHRHYGAREGRDFKGQ